MGPISKVILPSVVGRSAPVLKSRGRLSDGREEERILVELGLKGPLDLRMDLADAAPLAAEDVADLTQREVLDVEEDGDLALALRQLLERRAELGLGLRRRRRVLGVEPLVASGEGVDALDRG